jgi:NAD(P)-dependent dehydrogenase (short-subunit alcohol dehydrogenase family)
VCRLLSLVAHIPGIGRAAALALAREGAQLVVADVDLDGGHATAQAIVAAGDAATFIRVDVSSTVEVAAMVEHAIATYGRLDCAFNNAGINDEHAPAADLDEALWDRTIAISLKGIWLWVLPLSIVDNSPPRMLTT